MIVFLVLAALVIAVVLWFRSRRMGTSAKPVVNLTTTPTPRLRMRSARKGERL